MTAIPTPTTHLPVAVMGAGPVGLAAAHLLERLVINATGFRPDHTIAGELRLALDPALESAAALAPLIDPNVHTCGTVPAHGARELAHPEQGDYIVGMKSYGRAPTFLLATGYEQLRSVTAVLAGDDTAATTVPAGPPAARFRRLTHQLLHGARGRRLRAASAPAARMTTHEAGDATERA